MSQWALEFLSGGRQPAEFSRLTPAAQNELVGDEAAHAAAWRLCDDVEVCATEHAVWLRGPVTEAHEERLRVSPAGRRYAVLDDGQLVPHGARVPKGRLPNLGWQRLREWLVIALPLAAVPAKLSARVTLKIIRDNEERSPNVLVTSLDAWSVFASTAAQARLAKWSFAASADGRAAIRGMPLPPIAGEYYVETEGIAIAAGWQWSPRIDAAVLREALALEPGDVVLISPRGDYEVLPASEFVPASRGAVRTTREGWERERAV